MRTAFVIAADLLREAASRRWFIALAGGITLVLAIIGLSLRMDVVDGALAATRFFGTDLGHDIRSADVALRPVFKAASSLAFYGGLMFGILACADFAPSLLSPGRVEHVLALPVRRWELLVGTFAGVLVLALACALYGAAGLCVLLGAKTGVWTARPLMAALLGCASFLAIYAAMLATAVAARSASLSAAVGGALFVLGLVAGNRAVISPLIDPGLGRAVFDAVTLMVPRVSALGHAAASIAGSEELPPGQLFSLLAGVVLFGFGMLAVAIWHFERKDF